jgi:translation initiation factor IF-3
MTSQCIEIAHNNLVQKIQKVKVVKIRVKVTKIDMKKKANSLKRFKLKKVGTLTESLALPL